MADVRVTYDKTANAAYVYFTDPQVHVYSAHTYPCDPVDVDGMINLDFDELGTLPDDEVKSRLTALRGLGEWSADWFLARHLARPEAWPAGDLGLRKAVLAFYPGVTDVRAAGVRFHPFQNLSAHYLLAALRYP